MVFCLLLVHRGTQKTDDTTNSYPATSPSFPTSNAQLGGSTRSHCPLAFCPPLDPSRREMDKKLAVLKYEWQSELFHTLRSARK
ncbi:hypothetical protein PILCRDRAFT_818564 [Piloderma croceum F 1598]|uniref:Uncharacterized protein n=1 Tax=Piloderma croceum (strain F 1598) TaxID=765440 RepID=A0A0C3FXG9_PILCF|nr:hypothetical protein PILCRDRAFT_818564 [Piloderma croceum F 1598]